VFWHACFITKDAGFWKWVLEGNVISMMIYSVLLFRSCFDCRWGI